MADRMDIIEQFGQYLIDQSAVNAAGISKANQAISGTSHPADTVFIELGLVPDEKLADLLADFLDVPVDRITCDSIDTDLMAEVSTDFLVTNAVAPLKGDGEAILLCIADPLTSDAPDMIAYLLDRPVDIRVAPRRAISKALGTWIEQNTEVELVEQTTETALEADDIDRLKDIANEAPIVRLVANTVQQAVDHGATDIHIEPFSDRVDIRLRRDGVLTRVETISRQMHAGLTTRLKILARLNIAERRLPQDGRMRLAVRGQEIDLRVSAMPSVHGETFVLRILNRETVPLNLGALGYREKDAKTLKRLSRLSNGLVLITGPTGSGKTTTLYAMINEIDMEHVKVFTVEDPVEYRMDGITQVQVNAAIDLDFARTLRTVLRQDPDVILVGEIRDAETARIAIRAALTGHLVFATLHTNSAVGAFSRLIDMGIESYLLADTVRAVIAQRLLRLKCKECQGNAPDCATCAGSGYHGRISTYEILELNETLSGAVQTHASDAEILSIAKRDGFETITQHALSLVREGATDEAEIHRVLDGGGS